MPDAITTIPDTNADEIALLLTPPPSVERLALFLDDLRLRQGTSGTETKGEPGTVGQVGVGAMRFAAERGTGFTSRFAPTEMASAEPFGAYPSASLSLAVSPAASGDPRLFPTGTELRDFLSWLESVSEAKKTADTARATRLAQSMGYAGFAAPLPAPVTPPTTTGDVAVPALPLVRPVAVQAEPDVLTRAYQAQRWRGDTAPLALPNTAPPAIPPQVSPVRTTTPQVLPTTAPVAANADADLLAEPPPAPARRAGRRTNRTAPETTDAADAAQEESAGAGRAADRPAPSPLPRLSREAYGRALERINLSGGGLALGTVLGEQSLTSSGTAFAFPTGATPLPLSSPTIGTPAQPLPGMNAVLSPAALPPVPPPPPVAAMPAPAVSPMAPPPPAVIAGQISADGSPVAAPRTPFLETPDNTPPPLARPAIPTVSWLGVAPPSPDVPAPMGEDVSLPAPNAYAGVSKAFLHTAEMPTWASPMDDAPRPALAPFGMPPGDMPGAGAEMQTTPKPRPNLFALGAGLATAALLGAVFTPTSARADATGFPSAGARVTGDVSGQTVPALLGTAPPELFAPTDTGSESRRPMGADFAAKGSAPLAARAPFETNATQKSIVPTGTDAAQEDRQEQPASRLPGATAPANTPLSRDLFGAALGAPNRAGVRGAGVTGEPQSGNPFGAKPPAARALDPTLGQITLIAPPMTVASADAERGGAAVRVDWSGIARGAGTLDAGGLASLKAVLPPGAQAIYPALTPGAGGANAVNLALAPSLLRDLVGRGYGDTGAGANRFAEEAAVRGRAGLPAMPSAEPLQAALVPAPARPIGATAGVLGTAKPAGALEEAGGAAAKRGGVLDFLGMPVRLAPSLGGNSDLAQETAVRGGGLTGGEAATSAVRPEKFAALQKRLFPAFSQVTTEPDKEAWRKAAPAFGMRDASPTTLLAPDARVPDQNDTAPAPQTGQSLAASIGNRFAPGARTDAGTGGASDAVSRIIGASPEQSLAGRMSPADSGTTAGMVNGYAPAPLGTVPPMFSAPHAAHTAPGTPTIAPPFAPINGYSPSPDTTPLQGMPQAFPGSGRRMAETAPTAPFASPTGTPLSSPPIGHGSAGGGSGSGAPEAPFVRVGGQPPLLGSPRSISKVPGSGTRSASPSPTMTAPRNYPVPGIGARPSATRTSFPSSPSGRGGSSSPTSFSGGAPALPPMPSANAASPPTPMVSQMMPSRRAATGTPSPFRVPNVALLPLATTGPAPSSGGGGGTGLRIQRSVRGETTTGAGGSQDAPGHDGHGGSAATVEAEQGNAAAEVNLLATEVYSLLKRRFALEAQRHGR